MSMHISGAPSVCILAALEPEVFKQYQQHGAFGHDYSMRVYMHPHEKGCTLSCWWKEMVVNPAIPERNQLCADLLIARKEGKSDPIAVSI